MTSLPALLFFSLVSLARYQSILLIFSKNQILDNLLTILMHYFISSSEQLCGLGKIMIPSLQMRTGLELLEAAHGHMESQRVRI